MRAEKSSPFLPGAFARIAACLIVIGLTLFFSVAGSNAAPSPVLNGASIAQSGPSFPPVAANPLNRWFYIGREDAFWRLTLLQQMGEIDESGFSEAGRITVLLVGFDARENRVETWRTDVLMLLTLDPHAKGAGVLSIPRDLYVDIPGYGSSRINTAYGIGNSYGYPGGGEALLKATVARVIGVKADYMVRVDFHGFVKLIDLIGGIDVVVEKPIDDPNYPGFNDESYEHLYIAAGPHHFDGEMALKFARSRHGTSDFDRAGRQQQVLRAVLQRVTQLDMLPQQIRQAPEILRTMESSVQTDLPLGKMLRLATAVTTVDDSTIRSAVIDASCTRPWVTPYGGQVVLPVPARIYAVRNYVFQIAP